MNPELRRILSAGEPRAVEPGIASLLPEGAAPQRYDAIVASYDRVIGSRLYHWIAWGSDPAHDVAFAREAVTSEAEGIVLDAGCGSLLFTAAAHLASGRPTLLVDLSLGMLRRAKERLEAGGEPLPDRIALLQADLLELSIAPGSVRTVFCPGILHLFERPAALVARLVACLDPRGRLFLSTLVTDRPFGRRYLALLERRGEVHAPRDLASLRREVEGATDRPVAADRVGNVAYVRVGPSA